MAASCANEWRIFMIRYSGKQLVKQLLIFYSDNQVASCMDIFIFVITAVIGAGTGFLLRKITIQLIKKKSQRLSEPLLTERWLGSYPLAGGMRPGIYDNLPAAG